MSIHSTAVVHPKTDIAKDVVIGPYTVIGEDVILASEVKIGSHCVIEGRTSIGKGCEVFTGAVIGSIPQDKKFKKDEKTYLEIGEYNIIREYVTMNPGTGDGGKTKIGDHNLFMAYSHVAHDCVVGDHCTLANVGTLAGHVTLEDYVVIGGLTAIHQFVRLGRFSIVGGCSKVVQDIPPFSTCDGHPARVYGLNLVGLKRSGFKPDTVRLLKQAFKILFFSQLTKTKAVEEIKSQISSTPEIEHLLHFVQTSQRGLCS
ncbi:MAG TPA: acyl-ACP--UDP-N-acetylglucosamine O-acyltransferase [Candidatus Omnitrophota bacterium]|nr:acyl-ACP--UDP-N-acetylglucosamine O-acyltransferase [Candidatus Omnitrophota bacterium]